MIDPILLTSAVVVTAWFFRDALVPAVALSVVLWLVGSVLFIFGHILMIASASRGKRLLARLRWTEHHWARKSMSERRRRIAEQLIEHYQLDPFLKALAHGEPVAHDAVEGLIRDMEALNLWRYPFVIRKLSRSYLAKALVDTSPLLSLDLYQVRESLLAPAHLARRAFTHRLGLVFGQIVLRQRIDDISQMCRSLEASEKSREITKIQDFKFCEKKIYYYTSQAIDEDELAPEFANLTNVSLGKKRILSAIWQILFGKGIARDFLCFLLNPSHVKFLYNIRKQRVEHENWYQYWLRFHEQRAEVRRREAAVAKAAYEENVMALARRPIEDVLAERRSPGILLARTWPIGAPPPGRSHLGGLPCLPREMPWPRHGGNDTPLHFLAQIDCSELPDLDGASPLPRDGDLLFFASVDNELLWRDCKTSRVIFVPPNARTEEERPLPPDIPRIGWPQGGSGRGRSDVVGGSYPKWPISAHPFNTYDMSQYADDGIETLNAEQHRALVDALKMQARRILPNQEFPRIESVVQTNYVLDPEEKNFLRDEKGDVIYRGTYDARPLGSGFPYCGAILNALVSDLRSNAEDDIAEEEWRLSRLKGDHGDRSDQHRAKYGAKIRLLKDLLERTEALAARLGPVDDYSPAGDREREILAEWITTLLADAADVRSMGGRIQNSFRMALMCVSRRAVNDQRIAAMMPEEAHALNAERLHPQLEHTFHVMLGARYQWTNPTGGSGVSLLKLNSDYGMGFMFCDCGVAEFWIDPEDLAQQRFDRAYALTAGG